MRFLFLCHYNTTVFMRSCQHSDSHWKLETSISSQSDLRQLLPYMDNFTTPSVGIFLNIFLNFLKENFHSREKLSSKSDSRMLNTCFFFFNWILLCIKEFTFHTSIAVHITNGVHVINMTAISSTWIHTKKNDFCSGKIGSQECTVMENVTN